MSQLSRLNQAQASAPSVILRKADVFDVVHRPGAEAVTASGPAPPPGSSAVALVWDQPYRTSSDKSCHAVIPYRHTVKERQRVPHEGCALACATRRATTRCGVLVAACNMRHAARGPWTMRARRAGPAEVDNPHSPLGDWALRCSGCLPQVVKTGRRTRSALAKQGKNNRRTRQGMDGTGPKLKPRVYWPRSTLPSLPVTCNSVPPPQREP